MNYKAIIIFGSPGCGKGIQAELLTKNNYFHFSTGSMFRNLDSKTELGKKIKKIIDNGEFVSDDLVIKLFKETLNKYIKEKKFNPQKEILVLDGIPRTKEQVHLLNEIVNIKKIIYLTVSDKAVIERTKKRLREDDKSIEIVKKRLKIFKKNTLPVLKEYNRKLIVELNGENNIDETHREILKILK